MRVSMIVPILATAAVALSAPASAQLTDGAKAPEFTALAALGGDVQTFDLRAALANGPVVLYFFPKSFTKGCTIEAHAFSDHIADFKKLGATVIGVSADDIETQKKFSTQECRSNFLVASDPTLKIAAEYDAKINDQYANRTSYVIAPSGQIVEAYTDMEPLPHIDRALAALKSLPAH
ncbi:MAG TPA: peroxiredoxin [Candidatus Sulfotelmatobacter sp.]|nr:peroxiredoxin [Candidatus Sulfotelmatobacter sp.]